MTRDELAQTLTAAGLYPIPVEGDIERTTVRGMSFLGSLESFIQAAKALDIRCVFAATRVLQEPDFHYPEVNPGRAAFTAAARRGPHAEPAEEPADLRKVDAALGEFTSRLGQECGFRLVLHLPNTTLEYVLLLPWWQKFSELRQRAVDRLLDERDHAQARLVEEEGRRNQETLDALRELINDPQFLRLPTQLAMQAYALERVAGLDQINPNTLKLEIQSLDAKIKAKGLGRKR
jgi:hypothetical protein